MDVVAAIFVIHNFNFLYRTFCISRGDSPVLNTSSNQRLGVRSVVPVKLRVRC